MRIPFKFRHWALVIGHWAFALCAFAQTPADEPKPSKLRFLFLNETPGAFSLKTGADYLPISSAPYAISPPVTLQPKGRLEVFQIAPLPDPVTGKKDWIKIANITPPAGIVSALVVVSPKPPAPGSTDAPTCDVTFFDTDARAFPAGGIRMINLGRAQLGAQFDKATPIVLQPGETRITNPTPDPKNRIVARIAVHEGENWKLLSNKIVVLRPNQRLTGVFVYSSSGLLHTYTKEELAEFGKPAPGHFWLTYTDTP